MVEKKKMSLHTRIEKNNIPNPVMLSRQIDELREVMRRMRLANSDSLDAIISKKLDKFTQS